MKRSLQDSNTNVNYKCTSLCAISHIEHCLDNQLWAEIVHTFWGELWDHLLFSVSSTRFSLSSSQCSSSIQRSPPTRSWKDRVQHIQGSCSASPHSSLRRVSILSCSCPVVIHPSGLSFCLSLTNGKSWVSVLRVDGSPAGSPHSSNTPPFPQHVESTHRHAPRHVPLHGLRGNDCQFGLVLWCHWLRLCLWSNGKSSTNLNWSLPSCQKGGEKKKKWRKKKKSSQAKQQLWLTPDGWMIWRGARSDLIWFFLNYLSFSWLKTNGYQRGWLGVYSGLRDIFCCDLMWVLIL